jgi:hypothetical protein
MGKNSFILKSRLAAYWRYDRQCPIVAFEANTKLEGWNSGGQSDVLVIDKKGFLIETEVKVNLNDLRADREKPKHYHLYLDYYKDISLLPDVKGWRRYRKWLERVKELPSCSSEAKVYPISLFYFAVPEGMEVDAEKVRSELYPYAGLIVVRNVDMADWIHYINSIDITKTPHIFIRDKLTDKQILHMQREMSATICRLSWRCCQEVMELKI